MSRPARAAVGHERPGRARNARQHQPTTNGNSLPPENELDVKPEGTSGETVDQRRLREFYELQEQFYDLRDRYHAKYAQIQNLIIGGANIKQGTYKVEYGVRLTRRPKYKQVVIDLKGEAYQQRVLENTQPHQHFRVRVR